MPRRLPAGNRVVGHHGRDDPGRVLGRGALVGVCGLVDLGALDGPPIVRPPNRRRSAQSLAISENTAPIIPMTDLLLGSTCTTRLRCLSSRSDVVLVGKSRWAGVSASASYGISAALGQKLYIWAVTSRWSPLTSPRSRSVNTDFRIPSAAPFFCLVGALPAALRIRCAMQRCHASPG